MAPLLSPSINILYLDLIYYNWITHIHWMSSMIHGMCSGYHLSAQNVEVFFFSFRRPPSPLQPTAFHHFFFFSFFFFFFIVFSLYLLFFFSFHFFFFKKNRHRIIYKMDTKSCTSRYKYSLLMHCIKIKSPAKFLLNEQYVFVGGNISFLCVLSCSSEEA